MTTTPPTLVLLSGGQHHGNRKLHQALAELVLSKRKKLTYIPFCAEDSDIFFRRIIRRYKSYGFQDFFCLPVDAPISKKDILKALRNDAIYLAGGNTFYFLKYLKESGLAKELIRYAKDGGILAGLSAGAHILTKNIQLAGYPEYTADENFVQLKNLTSLGLANFEFYPHYYNSPKLSDALLKYSKKTKNKIYACPDGSGVVVKDKTTIIYGKATLFYRGEKTQLIP